jgi:hypothetical protein
MIESTFEPSRLARKLVSVKQDVGQEWLTSSLESGCGREEYAAKGTVRLIGCIAAVPRDFPENHKAPGRDARAGDTREPCRRRFACRWVW